MSGGTGIVPYNSELKRKAWMMEGLVQAASTSFWAPYTGRSKDGIVYQETNISSSEGHTVVFDFDGNLSGRAIKGKDTAYGRGEQKRKFSDKITVERYRLVVDNGDKFDGVDIGDLRINEHTDSRAKLADLFVRFKDQSLFDAAQGLLEQSPPPTHVIDLDSTFNYGSLLDIEKVLVTSNGFSSGGIRRPLDPFRLADGRPIWLFVVDKAMATLLKKDTSGYQALMASGDFRGNNNRVISGVLGRIGHLLIVEAPMFFGATDGQGAGWGLNDSNIEISGLRQYDGADPATAVWTGQADFDHASSDLHSRGLIFGQSALQLAMGKMPDYKLQHSQDFGITSESALEVWMEVKKTNLRLESGDNYEQAKITDLDFGCIAVDVEVQ